MLSTSRSLVRPPASSVSHGKQVCVGKLIMLTCGINISFLPSQWAVHIWCWGFTGKQDAQRGEAPSSVKFFRWASKDKEPWLLYWWSYDCWWHLNVWANHSKACPVVFTCHNLCPWSQAWPGSLQGWQHPTMVEAAYPTGTDLVKNKGQDKAGINDSQLWFGTYLHISIIMIATDLGLFISHQKPHW